MFTKRENKITSDPLCWIWLDLSWFMKATCSVATLTYLLIGAAIFDTIESEEERNQFTALQCKFSHIWREISSQLYSVSQSYQDRNQFTALQCKFSHIRRETSSQLYSVSSVTLGEKSVHSFTV